MDFLSPSKQIFEIIPRLSLPFLPDHFAIHPLSQRKLVSILKTSLNKQLKGRGFGRFSTVCKKACNWTLFWVTSIRFLKPTTIWYIITLLCHLLLGLSILLLQNCPHKYSVRFFALPPTLWYAHPVPCSYSVAPLTTPDALYKPQILLM
jgi:hypothetical protein